MKKGDKVLCVNGAFASRSTDPFTADEIHLPKRGKVYIVRSVIKTGYGTGLRLKERSARISLALLLRYA
ncbi:MAG: hypothetical protein HZC14_00770 [Candidatus Niyogibacteria bacterium]|nr:hypothetical protein [Candidatus Niyogibacteria bacterium]